MTLEECEMLNILLGVALIIENGKITGFNSRMYEEMEVEKEEEFAINS